MKILIRSPNWLGDAVMAIPSLMALHDHYPEASMTIVVKESFRPLFNLLSWPVETLPLSGLKSWFSLRKNKFDLAVIFPNSFRSALEVFLSRSQSRLGYAASFRRLFLSESIPLPEVNLHQADYYYCLLSPLGIKGNRPNPRLMVRDKDKELVSIWLREKGVDISRPIISIAPGANYGEAKCWPEERFALLIQKIAANLGEVVLAGTKEDGPLIERIIRKSRVKAWNLAGETIITTLASLFSISMVVISNDNGSMHLASAVGARVIALFGPTDPQRTRPLGEKVIILRDDVSCSPCFKRTCRDKKCFEAITVDKIYEKIF